jgi:hypothetical protein
MRSPTSLRKSKESVDDRAYPFEKGYGHVTGSTAAPFGNTSFDDLPSSDVACSA